jgi:inner membrane protein
MKRILSSSILVKVLALLALLFLASVPLSMIEGLIGERGAMKQSATSELAASYAGTQTLVGPILVVPWTERWTDTTRDGKGKIVDRTARSRSHFQLMYPDRMRVRGELAPDKRHRGIFTVLFYGFKGRIDGQFPAMDPATLHGDIEGSTIEIGAPVLAFSMSDVRGLQGAPGLLVAGEGASFLPRVPGLPETWPFQGVHAPLPAAALKAWTERRPMDFQLDLALTGQSRLGIVPLAGNTTAHITSSWPHPSFGGSFLATHRESAGGFEADWTVSSLASGARAQLTQIAASDKASQGVENFAVTLIDPLDVYALTGRAVKYGILFVALTLMAAFMFELMRNLKLHPVQYGLVGLAITLFFLLLLALSEKIAFGLAYAIATSGCVLLLAVYFSAVLGHWRRGVALGAYVGVLYAALYGLLLSEDNALLLGSVLLFGLLSLLMIATRKVDWYALSTPATAQATSPAAGQ